MDIQEKLIDLIHDFSTAMLVTRSDDGSLDARPMAVAQAEDDGKIWFVTDRSSGKIADLMFDSEVAVTMQGSSKYVSLSGIAHPVDDRVKLDELWSEAWKVWFPEGKASESILLLMVEPTRAEYWDNSGLTGVKYLLKAGKAYLQGERPSTDASTNASISL
ncbi:pyridoxamine 5'-phosphate oxidase family protein [Rubripirellula reticaptiva]|uniref:Pyridoxamine 5'-phosphate oxidase n=1 Tax=Rubripirellula reticaptiva TaxID=2528013 RepID=A0A5C6ED21_9BACT|nr:pyridoxamine 5'-phosphate oxidase family protein [Rubripirellula reticaptiva]TWU46818.1 Pyridoxamine 5'-phosphate oxidase [Rubripirellula reticaptiva]